MKFINQPDWEAGYCEVSMTRAESVVLIRIARFTERELEYEFFTRTAHYPQEVPPLIRAFENATETVPLPGNVLLVCRLTIIDYFVLKVILREFVLGIWLPEKYKAQEMYARQLFEYLKIYSPPAHLKDRVYSVWN